MRRIKRKELLLLLKRKASLKPYNLKGANFSRLNLSGYDLSFLDLSKAKFKKANLKKANFTKSILKRSCFLKANLEEATLKGANCTQADFTKANLYQADLTQANLQDIVAYKAKMKSVNLSKARLERTDLSHTDLSNIKARKANFQAANLNSSCLNMADLGEANFAEAILSNVEAKKANFSGCNLQKADLEGSFLDGSDFSRANLSSSKLSLASLKEINLEKATIRQTNFKYSRGLSEDMKQYLEQHQAKVSRIRDKFKQKTKFVLATPWAFALIIAFLIAGGIYGYFYFTSLKRLSIPSLQQKWKTAKQTHQYEKAIQIDLILIDKYEKNRNYERSFNKSFDLSKIYRIIGRKEKAIDLLEAMLEKFSDDSEKKAKIRLELALIYKDSRDLSKAISILNKINLSKLREKDVFSIEMELATVYQEAKRYKEALNTYSKIENSFNHDLQRLSNALRKMAGVYQEMGEVERSREAWAKVPWDPKNPQPYFKSQKNIASTLFQEKRFNEAKMVYSKLEEKLRSHPKLRKKVKKKLGRIEKKLKKKKTKS